MFIVAYDIGDPKRWRRVFRTMNGYGQCLQLSVFQCRLTARSRAELAAAVEGLIKQDEHHVVIIAVGPADGVKRGARASDAQPDTAGGSRDMMPRRRARGPMLPICIGALGVAVCAELARFFDTVEICYCGRLVPRRGRCGRPLADRP